MPVFYRLHQDQMQDSKRVKLDGFGSFKIGVSCKGARSAKAFTVTDNIHNGLLPVFFINKNVNKS